ncbi:MAG: hypothetical protein WBO36_02055 [Saprospiraceae bacterium]
MICSNLIIAQKQVSIDSVSAYIGKTVKVCDKVAGTFVTKSDKPLTYLDLGADFPNTKLTVVIFNKDLVKFTFSPSDHSKGMDVCVVGEISVYKERLQLIVNNPEQIEMKK